MGCNVKMSLTRRRFSKKVMSIIATKMILSGFDNVKYAPSKDGKAWDISCYCIFTDNNTKAYERICDIAEQMESNYKNIEQTNDPVNHPSHYTQGGIECIDAMKACMPREEFLGYLKGCAFKYLWRYEDKENPKQDLEKAQWYLSRLHSEYAFESNDQM